MGVGKGGLLRPQDGAQRRAQHRQQQRVDKTQRGHEGRALSVANGSMAPDDFSVSVMSDLSSAELCSATQLAPPPTMSS
jgi:hypothetical protein